MTLSAVVSVLFCLMILGFVGSMFIIFSGGLYRRMTNALSRMKFVQDIVRLASPKVQHFDQSNPDVEILVRLKQEKAFVLVETSNGMSIPGFITDLTEFTIEMNGLESFRPDHVAEDVEDGDDSLEARWVKFRFPIDMIIMLKEDVEHTDPQRRKIIQFARDNIIAPIKPVQVAGKN